MKRTRKTDIYKVKKRQRYAVPYLPTELWIYILEKLNGDDQIILINTISYLSRTHNVIATEFREKCNIPKGIMINIKVHIYGEGYFTPEKFYFSIPKHKIDKNDLYLLKCEDTHLFSVYIDFRGFSLSYAVCGWIYYKFKRYIIYSKPNILHYKLTCGVLPRKEELEYRPYHIPLLEQCYYYCILREEELIRRGWDWDSKWNGYASMNVDYQQVEDLCNFCTNNNYPPKFKWLKKDKFRAPILPIEIWYNIFKQVTGDDQVVILQMSSMTSINLYGIARSFQNRYNIPKYPVINIQITTWNPFNKDFFSIPKHKIDKNDLFVLKCASRREFQIIGFISETVASWIHNKFKRYIIEKVDCFNYSLRCVGMLSEKHCMSNEELKKEIQDIFILCKRRENELLKIGWDWTQIRDDFIHYTSINDTR
jgi:hypothetical protein